MGYRTLVIVMSIFTASSSWAQPVCPAIRAPQESVLKRVWDKLEQRLANLGIRRPI